MSVRLRGRVIAKLGGTAESEILSRQVKNDLPGFYFPDLSRRQQKRGGKNHGNEQCEF